MEAFRNVVTGWLGKTLLALITVPFALVGIYSYLPSGSSKTAVAQVNGEDVEQREFDQLLQQQRERQLQQMGPNADPAKLDEVKLHSDVIKSLVSRVALRQEANHLGFQVSDAFIDKLLRDEPSLRDEHGQFSNAKFGELVARSGETIQSFITKLKGNIASQELTGGLIQSAFATADDVKTLGVLNTQTRDAHVATLTTATFANGLTATDAEAKKFYEANPAKFTTDESVVLDFIELNRDDFAAQAMVADSDLQARYAEKVKDLANNEERHAQHILITVDAKTPAAEALKKIQEIEKRARSGEDFGQLAKQYSQDPGSAVNNGDLGFAGRKQFVPEFEAALYGLQVNQISAPVKTQYGYHLIKLLEVRKPTVPTFDQLRPTLEAEAKSAKADDLFGDAVDKVDSAVYEASDLKDPAAKFQLIVQTTAPQERHGTPTGIATSPAVLKAAFSDLLVKDGRNSHVIRLDPAHAVWLHVRNYQRPRLQPLAEQSLYAHNQVVLEKAKALAKAAADAMVKDLQAGKPLADVAAANHVQWQDVAGLGRSGTALPSDQIKQLFTLATPAAGKAAAKVMPVGDNFAVLAVTKVTPGTSLPYGPEAQQMASVLSENVGGAELSDYVAYLRSKAKIKSFDPKVPTVE